LKSRSKMPNLTGYTQKARRRPIPRPAPLASYRKRYLLSLCI
jgi:hypothetical protein